MEIYTAEFITDLALWQNGWREDPQGKSELARKLDCHRKLIPDVAKIVPPKCYRVLLLNKNLVGALFLEGQLSETMSSWTTKKMIAEKFKDYLGENQIGFIFAHKPEQHEVFLNFPAMWEDKQFQQDLEAHKKNGKKFHKALEYFRHENDQKEIILDVSSLKFNEIVGLSGRSSFDGLCKLAGANTESDKDQLWKDCVLNNHNPDDSVVWLSETGAWKVFDRVIDHMEKVLSGELAPLSAP